MMRGDTNWFRAAQWGVFVHYLADTASAQSPVALSVEDWNRTVRGFDAAGFAAQLASVGAKYCIFTIGQNSGYYCAPNPVYDEIVGYSPSRCSERDLMADIADALAGHGIRLLAYLPSMAPCNDTRAIRMLRCTPPWDTKIINWAPDAFSAEDAARTDPRLTEFQRNWERVVGYWSTTWGDKVSGWWIDGCYASDRMYAGADAPNFSSFAAALRVGNPQSIIAFNPGVRMPITSLTDVEDYTAGELDGLFACTGRRGMCDGQAQNEQLHVLTYLGDWWGQGEPRFPAYLVAAYTRFINSLAGVMTWDIPVSGGGRITPCVLEQLNSLSRRD